MNVARDATRLKQKLHAAKKKKAAADATRRELWSVAGLDVSAEAEACWKAVRAVVENRCRAPTIEIRKARPRWERSAGYARGQYNPRTNAITLWLTLDVPAWKVRAVVLHELCHAAVGKTDDGSESSDGWHGPAFRLALVAAAKKLWGVEVRVGVSTKYATDRNLEHALRALQNTGGRDD